MARPHAGKLDESPMSDRAFPILTYRWLVTSAHVAHIIIIDRHHPNYHDAYTIMISSAEPPSAQSLGAPSDVGAVAFVPFFTTSFAPAAAMIDVCRSCFGVRLISTAPP